MLEYRMNTKTKNNSNVLSTFTFTFCVTFLASLSIGFLLTSTLLTTIRGYTVLLMAAVYALAITMIVFAPRFQVGLLMLSVIYPFAFFYGAHAQIKTALAHSANTLLTAYQTVYNRTIVYLPEDSKINLAQAELFLFLPVLFILTGCLRLLVMKLKTTAPVLILTILLFAVPISVNIIPNTRTFILFLCLNYGSFAYHAGRKIRPRTQAATVVVITLIVALVVQAIIPEGHYIRPNSLTKATAYFTETLRKYGIYIDNSDIMNVANGGIGDGRVGQVHGIRFTGEPQLSVETIDTGHTQYLPVYLGSAWDTDDNSWGGYYTGFGYDSFDESLQQALLRSFDMKQSVHNQLEEISGVDYYKTLRRFPVEMKFLTGQNTEIYYTEAAIPFADYQIFEDFRNTETSMSDFKKRSELAEVQVALKSLTIGDNDRNTATRFFEEMGISYNPDGFDNLADEGEFINAVREALARRCQYSLTPGKVPSSAHLLDFFLNEHRVGYCEYFATAATLLFRASGIPARYVEGYALPAEQISAGEEREIELPRTSPIIGDSFAFQNFNVKETARFLDVTDRNAHAWVQVYINGYGWLSIDVTPSSPVADGMETAATLATGTTPSSNPATQKNKESESKEPNENNEKKSPDDEDIEKQDFDNQSELTEEDIANDNTENGRYSALPAPVVYSLRALFTLLIIFVLLLLAGFLRLLFLSRKLESAREIARNHRNSDEFTKLARPVVRTEHEYLKICLAARGMGPEPAETIREYFTRVGRFPLLNGTHAEEIAPVIEKLEFSSTTITYAEYLRFSNICGRITDALSKDAPLKTKIKILLKMLWIKSR